MKYLRTAILVWFAVMPILTGAQSIDSTVIRQVDSLLIVSRDLTDKHLFDQAMEVIAQAETLSLEKGGRNSAIYGLCCFNHGRVLSIKKDFIEAEKWYLEAKIIQENASGINEVDYASTVNALGSTYSLLRQFEKAEPLLLQAISIRESELDIDHPDYARSLKNIGNLYSTMGQYSKAVEYYLDAKLVFERAMGQNHPTVCQLISILGDQYWNMGLYEKAEPYYYQAMAALELTFGKEHPQYFKAVHELANLYILIGQFEKAEPLLLQARKTLELVVGNEHPAYASLLQGLGDLYRHTGAFDKSESYYLQAISIREKVLGPEHPEYAWSLNNLGNLYSIMGRYEKSVTYHIKAKMIREKVLGKDHLDYGSSLNNLGVLYKSMGQFHEAEKYYSESKLIKERTLGKGHPEYASTVYNLAELYYLMQQFEIAETLFQESGRIIQHVYGKSHPNYSLNASGLALLYMDWGQYDKAEPLFLEVATVDKRMIERFSRYLSELELNKYLNLFSTRQLHNFFSFIQLNKSPEMCSAGFDNILFYKGFLLNATTRIKDLAHSDSSAKEKYKTLQSYKRQLVREYIKPLVEQDSTLIADFEEVVNVLEKDLANTISGYGDINRQVNWSQIQQELESDEAAVEFMHYRSHDEKLSDSVLYAALVVRPGLMAPEFVSLFEEKSLHHLIGTQGGRKADYVNALYSLAERGLHEENSEQKAPLIDLIWRPLEPYMNGVRTVYFSPSGLLHRINLSAIPISESETLADRIRLVELQSTRQLVIPIQPQNTDYTAASFGGINYESDSTILADASQLVSRPRGELSFDWVDSVLRGGSWSTLSSTATEVSTISSLASNEGWAVTLFQEGNAREEAIKTLGSGKQSSPQILHIATHGYFFPDPKTTKTAWSGEESVFRISDHPMLRSGLILAGGNAGWKGDPIPGAQDDGVLTAFEISQLNLSNTELVVLSACETGLGDIQGNEGVYGLQRAFKIAGAKYLIMSLWQVPDKQTSMLMTKFYQKWLEEKMEIPEAFRAAQKEMRDLGFDPYQWAGFVLVE